jgi:hypothetical protein
MLGALSWTAVESEMGQLKEPLVQPVRAGGVTSR